MGGGGLAYSHGGIFFSSLNLDPPFVSRNRDQKTGVRLSGQSHTASALNPPPASLEKGGRAAESGAKVMVGGPLVDVQNDSSDTLGAD